MEITIFLVNQQHRYHKFTNGGVISLTLELVLVSNLEQKGQNLIFLFPMQGEVTTYI